MKKGFIFTIDAMIGLSVMILIVITVAFVKFETLLPAKIYEKLNFVADDTMNLLAHLEVHEVQDTPTIKELIDKREIVKRDLNKTVLDLIASFWYKGNYTIAENISRDVLTRLPNDICLNLTLGAETIYSSCSSSPREVAVSNRIESGYEPGKPAYGYISRAFLTHIRGKKDSSYTYFGGYVGDGNITRLLTLPNYDSILEAYMELDVGNNFTLYINDNFSGNYINGSSGGDNMTADKWIVCNETYHPEYCLNFTTGNNILSFNFTGNRSFIGGGYFRVTYNTTELSWEEEKNSTKYWFPGIHGLINLYSSFYIPGDLNSILVHLHYKSNYTAFLTIGNTEVYNNDSTDEVEIDIANTTLADNLNYTELGRKTVPIRLGVRTPTGEGTGNGDVVLITDLSSSMNWRLDTESTGTERSCDDPNLYNPSTKRISLAKCLDKDFIDIILNSSENRIGLIGFYGDYTSPFKGRTIIHDFSTNKTSLYNAIDNYFVQDGTCICCGINKAFNILNEQSNASRQKFIVVMSDGIPTHQCGSSGIDECRGTRDGSPSREGLWLGYGAGCYGGMDDCDTTDCSCAMQNANWSSCRANSELNTTVYSIGFGPVASCWSANWTLREVANCGGGSYYASSNATELKEIYQTIAQQIVKISYIAQMIEVTGNVTMNNILYSDSYIELNYTPILIPSEYGEISLTKETERLSNFTGDDVDIPYKEGWFNISEKVKIVDAKITSYSSEFWTDRLYVKNSTDIWTRVYWLGDYGNNYQKLGDPYIVQIPVNLVGAGNNSVRIGTGLNPNNATGGSPDDRLIYTVRVKGSVGYGDIFNTSERAVNDATQRLIDKVSDYVDVTVDDIDIGTKALKGIQGLWGPTLIKILVWENRTT